MAEPLRSASLEDSNSKPLISIIFGLLAVVAIGSFLVNEIYEPDVWWHLAIGGDIIRHHAVPAVDRYTLAGLGRAYHDSHWLFQVALSLMHRAGGMAGVEALMVGIWSLTFLLTLRTLRKWVALPVACALVFCVALASVERFLPRPEIISYLMLALFSLRLSQGRYRSTSDLVLLGIFQVIWTNCHGLFVIGPCLVGAYWLVAAPAGPHGPGSEFRSLGKALAVVLVASLVSPFGIQGWEYALLLMTEVNPEAAAALKTVGELSPTFGQAARSAPAFWFYLGLLIISALATALDALRGRIAVPRVVVAVAMLGLSLTGRRNMPLFALVAAPLIAEHSGWLCRVIGRKTRTALLSLAGLLMAACSAYALSGAYYLKMEIPARFGWGVTPSYYPHGLPDFLRKSGFRGNVFNSNLLGGFYLYHFFPAGLPLTDGRWEIYDRAHLEAIRKAGADPVLLQRIVSHFEIRGFLLLHTSPEAATLLPMLAGNPRWRLVYYDQAASFWARSDLPHLPVAVDLAGTASLPAVSRIDDSIILDRFYRGVAAANLRLRNLDRIAASGELGEKTLQKLGNEDLQSGRLPEAEQIFQKLNRVAPRNTAALNELAFFAYQRGDRAAALSFLRAALEVHPNDPEISANYKRLQGGE